MKRILLLAILTCCATPVLAQQYLENWENFYDDMAMGGMVPEWQPLTTNYSMAIGMVETANWYLAWKNGDEAGVLLEYIYASPVSPPNLPGPGPMKYEQVEITLDCRNRTVRFHNFKLYSPDNRYIGKWFDPQAEAQPSSFGSSGIIEMAYTKAC